MAVDLNGRTPNDDQAVGLTPLQRRRDCRQSTQPTPGKDSVILTPGKDSIILTPGNDSVIMTPKETPCSTRLSAQGDKHHNPMKRRQQRISVPEHLRWIDDRVLAAADQVQHLISPTDSTSMELSISQGLTDAAAVWNTADAKGHCALSYSDIKMSLKNNASAKDLLMHNSSWSRLLSSLDPTSSGQVTQLSFVSFYLSCHIASCAETHCQHTHSPTQISVLRESFTKLGEVASHVVGALVNCAKKPSDNAAECSENEDDDDSALSLAPLSHRKFKTFLQQHPPLRLWLFGLRSDHARWGEIFVDMGSLNNKRIQPCSFLGAIISRPLRSDSARLRAVDESAKQIAAAGEALRLQLLEAATEREARREAAREVQRAARAAVELRKKIAREESKARENKWRAVLRRRLKKEMEACDDRQPVAVADEVVAPSTHKLTPLQRRHQLASGIPAASHASTAAPSKRQSRHVTLQDTTLQETTDQSMSPHIRANLAFFERFDLATGFPNLAASMPKQRPVAVAEVHRSKSVGRVRRPTEALRLDAWDLHLRAVVAATLSDRVQAEKASQEPAQSGRSHRAPRVGGASEQQDWSRVSAARRISAAPQVQRSAGAAMNRKLEEADQAASLKKLGKQCGLRIQQARSLKKMSQAALAQLVNEKPAVINQYERGDAIPSHQVINKLEMALGAKLR